MAGTGGFQTLVYNQPAFGVAGDFASMNPYFTYDAGAGGLVAGAGGVNIGLFAWVYPPDDPDGTGEIVQNFGFGPPAGFVHRAQQGLITTYLANAGVLIQPGFQMGLMIGGDFWVVNNGSSIATRGQKAFANLLNGQASFAAAGTIVGGASATGSTIAPATFSVTGSITGNVMTVSAVGSGTVYPGSTVSGTNILGSPMVTKQLTGTTGGVGTYLVNVLQPGAVASTTISGTYGLFTIGTATGTFAVGDVLTGTNVVAGTAITANITGTGGTGGTMVANNNTNVGSTTITGSTAAETRWYAQSSGNVGELVKISDHYGTFNS